MLISVFFLKFKEIYDARIVDDLKVNDNPDVN
jgi:hypothetical protein